MDINYFFESYNPCPICGGNSNNDIVNYCVTNFDFSVNKQPANYCSIWLSPQTFESQRTSPRIGIDSINKKIIYVISFHMNAIELDFSLIENSLDIKDFMNKIKLEAERIEKMKSFL
jgi:hypothetical protein